MQVWFAPEIVLEGVPTDEGWPSTEQLKPLLRSQPYTSVTTHDIETDCKELLATGLFGSVRPILKPPSAWPTLSPACCISRVQPCLKMGHMSGSIWCLL